MRVLFQRIALSCTAAFLLAPAAKAAAQGVPAEIHPAPPIAPETITRDAAGQATVRAIRLSEPLRVDGALDESVYATNLPFGGFIQVVPKAGAPSSERTDVWVMFDARHMYVGARCWDSAPPDKWVANELRRDTNQLRQNDTFGVMFDTFYDRRSGFMFYTNPLGALADYSVVDEGPVEHRLESGLERAHRTLRRRLDRRDGDSVQDAALPFRPGTGLGHPAAARRSAGRTSGRT